MLSFTTAAHGFGPWDKLREQAGKLGRAPAEVLKSLPKPAQDAGSEAARALGYFSLEEELAIGRRAAGNLLGTAPLVKDARLQRYVNLVGRWIASRSERPDLPWRFGVIASPDVNAFAAPGGYVFVTAGLYRHLHSESELAGVLAHEIAHVVRKHHLKILEQSRLLDRGGKLLSGRLGGDDRIRKLIGSGAEMFSRALDKDAEYEADRLAMVLAARAGYDPFGLPVVLQDLGHLSGEDRSVALLFKTHPHPDARLANLDETGERLEGIRGRVNQRRFYRIRP